MGKTKDQIIKFLQETSIWENTNQDILIFITSILLGLIFKGIISLLRQNNSLLLYADSLFANNTVIHVNII